MPEKEGEYIFINMAASYKDNHLITQDERDQFVDALVELAEARGMIMGGSMWLGNSYNAWIGGEEA